MVTASTPTRAGAPALALTGLAKHFGHIRAVDGVDLEVARGETVALLGPNGAGKTTTISVALGALDADGGEARLFGRPPREAVAAGQVGAMLQEGGLPTGVTVAELVDFARALYPHSLSRAETLATAGLTGLEGHRVDRLSGGQTQRLRFAFALAGSPDLLVLDEPTAAMDVESRRAFWASMHEYAAGGRTVLFSTHYLEEADAHADRIVVIARGRVVADGSASEIKRSAGTRVVAFDLAGSSAEGLERLPGVASVERQADRVTLRTTDADQTAAALILARGAVRNLEVTGGGLEEAFLSLTREPADADPAPTGGVR